MFSTAFSTAFCTGFCTAFRESERDAEQSTGHSTEPATEQSTEQSTGSRHLYQHLYRHLNQASTGSMGRDRSFADVISETLARDAAQIRIMVHDVEKVSAETMTETMTNGRKKKKRDTTHRRIALRVAPPGLEPGLS